MPTELDDTELDDLLKETPEQEEEEGLPEPEEEPLAAAGDDEGDEEPPEKETAPDSEADQELYADEEGDSLSTKMRKRIYRERRKFAEEQAMLEDRMYEQVMDNLSLRAEAAEHRAKSIEAEMGEVRRQLKTAKEEGNTDKETELTEKLATLRYRHEKTLDDGKEAKSRFERAKTEKVPAMARAWVKVNSWFAKDDPRYTQAQEYARQVDAELAKSGKDQNSPDYYREIDRRVQKRFGNLFGMKKTNGSRNEERETQGRRPSSPTGGIRPSPSGGGGPRSTITKSEQDRMVEFGLDPKDPKQVARWVRESREIAKTSGGSGR